MSEDFDPNIVPEFDMEEGPKKRFTVWERAAGPLTSALVHVVILIILAVTVTAVVMQEEKKEEQKFEVIQPKVEKLEEIEELIEELEETQDDLPPSEFVNDFSVDTPIANMQSETTTTDPVEVDIKDISIISDSPSPIVMQGLFANRSAAGRKAALNRFGGGGGSEKAVMKALNWLHRNQIKDGNKAGTWPTSGNSGAAMAGFGLLTFLAHGELPTSKKYGSTVQLAIDYLLRTQKENGQWQEKGGHEYGHAIATYAVAEAYAMTKHPSLKYAMEKGVGRIIDGTILERFPMRESMQKVFPYDTTSDNRVTGGFWNYDYADGAWPGGYKNDYMNGGSPMQPKYSSGVRKDHSYMGFQMQALKAAKFAGSSNPKLDETIKLAVNGMKFMHGPKNGSYQYSNQTSTPNGGNGTANQLGVGGYCIQLLEGPNSPEAKRSIEALYKSGFDPQAGRAFYRIYYKANANFWADGTKKGGANWTQYNAAMKPWLLKNQNADGSWAHAAVGQPDTHGIVYSTCLGALSLMVYYRNLPGSQGAQGGAVAMAPEEEAVKDIGVEVKGKFDFDNF